MGALCGKEAATKEDKPKGKSAEATKTDDKAQGSKAKGGKKAAEKPAEEEARKGKKAKAETNEAELEAKPKAKKPKAKEASEEEQNEKKPKGKKDKPAAEPEETPKAEEKKPKGKKDKPAAEEAPKKESSEEKSEGNEPEKRKTLEEATAETEVLYKKYRAEADEHAKLRAKFFDEASAAHDAGDGAKAKELSTKAKEHGRLMEEASLKGAKAIFEGKNKEQPKGTIDLHGLHVKEAELIVKEQLEKAKKGGASELKIIIGAGHHSDEKGPKVGPAIKKLLETDKIKWENDETNKSGGCIIASW